MDQDGLDTKKLRDFTGMLAASTTEACETGQQNIRNYNLTHEQKSERMLGCCMPLGFSKGTDRSAHCFIRDFDKSIGRKVNKVVKQH